MSEHERIGAIAVSCARVAQQRDRRPLAGSPVRSQRLSPRWCPERAGAVSRTASVRHIEFEKKSKKNSRMVAERLVTEKQLVAESA